MSPNNNNKDDVVEGDVDIPSEPAAKTLQLPNEVALLPIRNRVLLPGGLLRLTIGRPKSVSLHNPRFRKIHSLPGTSRLFLDIHCG